MNTISEQTQTQRKLTPRGTHVARCVAVVDLGTAPDTYEGKTTVRRKLSLTWEFPKQLIEKDGETFPMQLSRTFTASLYQDSAFRGIIDPWLAPSADEIKKFNPSVLAGKECLVSVIHETKKNGDPVDKVSSVSSLPDGTNVPETATEPWEYDPEKPTVNFDRLKEWQQKRVRTSEEYKNAMKGKHDSSGLDETDNDPFAG